MHVNPVKRELIKNALITITDNMVVTVIRTSRSTVVKTSLDFSTSICDSEGRMVAQGLSLPVHLGATMPALKGCLDYFGDDIHPGDILASNDPYAGASHLNDIFMFKPVYENAELVLYLSIILHTTRTWGGRVPGGNATDSTEIFQEGLRIPPTKIYERGSPNATLFRIIEHNVRVPDKVMGDVRSQIAALELGQRDVLKLLDEYDTREFKAYMTELIDYTERRTRSGIAEIPDGEAEFTEWNDDNGVGGDPGEDPGQTDGEGRRNDRRLHRDLAPDDRRAQPQLLVHRLVRLRCHPRGVRSGHPEQCRVLPSDHDIRARGVLREPGLSGAAGRAWAGRAPL